jgi:ABC-type transport system involved in cytochrome c biogenesis permease subunit
LFFIYPGALRFQEFSADVASIFICIGLINISIIKFFVNWWNTLHQPSSISQFGLKKSLNSQEAQGAICQKGENITKKKKILKNW